MTCTICRRPADDSHASVTLSRKLEGLECEADLIELPGCDISDVYRYTVHADCLPMLQHKVGGHEKTPCPTCETCQMEEIRSLESELRMRLQGTAGDRLPLLRRLVKTAEEHKTAPEEPLYGVALETLALDEIRRLSPNAKNLILHRLRNPLCILIMAAELILVRDGGVITFALVNPILEAAKRIDRELNALFVVH